MNDSLSPPFWVVVPAAGIGSRMRADRPKQYLQVAGKTILEHTLERLLAHPTINGVVVSIADDDHFWPSLGCACDSRIRSAQGGSDRATSVLNALLLLSEDGADLDDWVLVHDAARPNLAQTDLDRLLSALRGHAVGGLLAAPVRDTLKRASPEGLVQETVDRTQVWQAFTPQMFRLGALQTALSEALAAGVSITDESSAMEWAGHAPRLIEGRSDNLKITRPEDLDWLVSHWAGSAGAVPG